MSLFGLDPLAPTPAAQVLADSLAMPMYPAQTAGSFSAVKQHRDCPRVIRYRRIDRLPEPKSEHLQRGIDSHASVENFIAGKTDQLPDFLDPTWLLLMEGLRRNYQAGFVKVEQQIAFTNAWAQTEWFAKNVWWRTIFDVIEYAPVPGESVDVYEWKTGKEYAEDHELQSRMYAFATFILLPDVNTVRVHLGYLDRPMPNGGPKRLTYARDQLQALEDEFNEFVREYYADTMYPARPSWKCNYCHFRRTNAGPCEHG